MPDIVSCLLDILNNPTLPLDSKNSLWKYANTILSNLVNRCREKVQPVFYSIVREHVKEGDSFLTAGLSILYYFWTCVITVKIYF